MLYVVVFLLGLGLGWMACVAFQLWSEINSPATYPPLWPEEEDEDLSTPIEPSR